MAIFIGPIFAHLKTSDVTRTLNHFINIRIRYALLAPHDFPELQFLNNPGVFRIKRAEYKMNVIGLTDIHFVLS